MQDARADARGCPCGCGRPLRRTTADAKNPRKKAADAFPAFEKYKVIERNPPCGCPMAKAQWGVGHCMGGRGRLPSGSLLVEGLSSSHLRLPCLFPYFAWQRLDFSRWFHPNLRLPGVESQCRILFSNLPLLRSHQGLCFPKLHLPRVDFPSRDPRLATYACHALLAFLPKFGSATL